MPGGGHSLKSTLATTRLKGGKLDTQSFEWLEVDTSSYVDYNVFRWISETKLQEQFLVGYSQYVQ